MKKTVLFALFISVLNSLSAQNGGQSSENDAIKIEFSGTTPGGQSIIKVTNKQQCGSDIMLIYGARTRTKFVNAQSSDTFIIIPPSSCRAMAQPTIWCGGMNFGVVETTACASLPVKFEYFTARCTGKNEIEVEFKISEVIGSVQQFNVQISTDGINYRTIRVILPTEAKQNSIYNAKIKL